MSHETIMSRPDFDALLISGVNDIRQGEKKIGTALHDAIRAGFFRGELDRLNALTLSCQKLALNSVISRAIKILAGGYYTTSDGTRYYKEDASILTYDNKAHCWAFTAAKSEKLAKVKDGYINFAKLELRDITAKNPEVPLTLEPIRKYIQKLSASGAKWDDRERETIKKFLTLTSGLFDNPRINAEAVPAQTDGQNICAAQTSGLDGKPQAPRASRKGK